MINNECSKAMNDFNDSESLGDVCKASYESIVGPRDPNCTGERYILCEGICLQPAKTISCNCHEGVGQIAYSREARPCHWHTIAVIVYPVSVIRY